jgi:polyisoprenoid-binding protein YceI
MTRSFVRAALALAVLAPASLAAQARPHDIDAAHSEINFTAESRLLSAHGFFGKWNADVAFDPANPAASKVKITIDAASINTRNDRRDGHLRSADFFDVEKFPEITFVSKRIEMTGAATMNIVGDLTIHGVTKEVVVPASMVFYDEGVGRFKGMFSIKRKDYGVAYDSRLNPIQDDVQIGFEMTIKERKQG